MADAADVARLEAALRTRLFDRESDGVRLTAAGRVLHGYARRLRELAAEARDAVTGVGGQITGDLALAASSLPGQNLLPPLLAAFRRTHPLIQFRVSVADTDAALREVEAGRAHLGLTGGTGGGPGLIFRRIAGDELALVLPRGHAWWRRQRVTVSDLLSTPVVQREPGSASRRCLEAALERAGVSPSALTVALELGSTEVILEAVTSGLGVAILSRREVRKDVRAGRVRTVPVAGLTLTRDVYVVRARDRALPPSADHFLRFLDPASADRSA
jgi:LysR family transcriptional regulator, low CO2-responsive transcriptional regulator